MTPPNGSMFSVGLVERPELPNQPQWVVTCDRCGADLSSNYDPTVIINFKDQVPAIQLETFKRQLYKAIAEGRSPLVMNADTEVFNLNVQLQRVLLEHHRNCAKMKT